MVNNSTLDAMMTALSILRKIYSSSSVDDYGNVVISENSYPDFFKEIVVEMGKLERIIASSLETTKTELTGRRLERFKMNKETNCRDPVRRSCYDCGKEHEYSDDEIYEYFDSKLGGLFAFDCKSCLLTNSW